MSRFRKLLFILFALMLHLPLLAQSDIEISGSKEEEWGECVGGGIEPSLPLDQVTEIRLSKSQLTIESGELSRLRATVNASAANKALVWTSGNVSIAQVTANGVVVGYMPGTTTIRVTSVSNPEIFAECVLTVTDECVVLKEGWLLPWGKDEPWDSKYLFQTLAEYAEPACDANGNSWKELEYDDSAWETLTGPMGSSSVGYAPYNYLWNGYQNCFCLRRKFNLEALGVGRFTFHVIHDDAVRVFLNGVQVVECSEWSNEKVRTFEIPAEVFVKGENLLAIYIEQGTGGAYLDYGLHYEAPADMPMLRLILSHDKASIRNGDKLFLSATANIDVDCVDIEWSVDDDEVVSLTEHGVVTGMKRGTATVKATYKPNPSLYDSCTVTVTDDNQEQPGGWIIPWGCDEPWNARYHFSELAGYSEPENDSDNLTWKEYGYDDGDWPVLRGPMGSRDISYAPYNFLWEGTNNCYCIRYPFHLAFVSDGIYEFSTKHDDGIIVYVNGKKVIDSQTYTDNRVETFILPNDVFHSGENMLAVYIKQNEGGAYLDFGLKYTSRKITDIVLSDSEVSIEIGEKFSLGATVNEIAVDKRLVWKVEDDDILHVSPSGVLTGKKAGTTVVSVVSVSNPEVTASCTVCVQPTEFKADKYWVVPWGKNHAWAAEYRFWQQSGYSEPTVDSNGNKWIDVGYDTSGWGILTGPIGTYLPYNHYWEGTYNCYCIRHSFYLNRVDEGAYILNTIHDDAAVIYLNGKEVVNEPFAAIDATRHEIPTDLFREGINVLAVYIRQDAGAAYLDFGIEYNSSEVTGIELSHSELSIEGGASVAIVAKVNEYAADNSLVWSIDNDEVAWLLDNGLVIGRKTGTAVVKVTSVSNPDVSATCRITVTSDYEHPLTGYARPWGKDNAWKGKFRSTPSGSVAEPSSDSNGTPWFGIGYDDSDWDGFTGPLASSNVTYAPYNSMWNGNNNCYYLRIPFRLIDVGDGVYRLSIKIGENAVVYLNGEKVLTASSPTDNNAKSLMLPNELLRTGQNLLAVSVKRNSGNAYFDYSVYYTEPADTEFLPDVPFEFFFDAADYDTLTCSIPNHEDAGDLRDANLKLEGNIPEYLNGRSLDISKICKGYIDKWEQNSTASGGYFACSGTDSMTIVCKVRPRMGTGNTCDFISNRGHDYNYMFRIGSENSFYLHTADAYDSKRAIVLPAEEMTQLLAVRVDGKMNLVYLDNLTTGDSRIVSAVNWGGKNTIFKFFYNNDSEYYTGLFYWVYYSKSFVTDSQLFSFVDYDRAIRVIGDVNNDEKVSVVDVTMTINEILRKDNVGFDPAIADINEDGRISIVDVTLITNIILNQ